MGYEINRRLRRCSIMLLTLCNEYVLIMKMRICKYDDEDNTKLPEIRLNMDHSDSDSDRIVAIWAVVVNGRMNVSNGSAHFDNDDTAVYYATMTMIMATMVLLMMVITIVIVSANDNEDDNNDMINSLDDYIDLINNDTTNVTIKMTIMLIITIVKNTDASNINNTNLSERKEARGGK